MLSLLSSICVNIFFDSNVIACLLKQLAGINRSNELTLCGWIVRCCFWELLPMQLSNGVIIFQDKSILKKLLAVSVLFVSREKTLGKINFNYTYKSLKLLLTMY